jgi:hypothetical protein
MKTLIIVCSLLISVCAYSQNEKANLAFEKAKGTLNDPVKHLTRIEVPAEVEKDFKVTTAAYTGTVSDTIRAIFEGKVTSVSKTGEFYTVDVMYGDYVIIYQGLNKPELTVGTVLKKNDFLGTSVVLYGSAGFAGIGCFKEGKLGRTLVDIREWLKK